MTTTATDPSDDGLTFLATVTKADGAVLTRETPNRAEYLAWVDAHYQAGDGLVVTIESRGPGALNMLRAIAYGARQS